MSEYADVRNEPFSRHPLAQWIRRDLPQEVASAASEHPSINWVASPGRGGWASTPWIAGFDPLVTDSAQSGYYPVYLFTTSLDSVYLSMNQGMAQLRSELGTQAKETLRYRSSILRARLAPGYVERFPQINIDLEASGSQSRVAFYESGHIFGTRYEKNAMPAESQLADDLAEMLELYWLATVLGGTQELDTTGHAIMEVGEKELVSSKTLLERRQLRFHYRVERNQRLAKLAKEYHGYSCQICGFDFKRAYGSLGEDFIEAHHLTPVAELPPNTSVQLSPAKDFAVVCSNCHRMLHRQGAPDSFEEFVEWYRAVQSGVLGCSA